MLKYTDANEILLTEFENLKTAFSEHENNDLFILEDGCYSFYEQVFAPYVIKQLDDGNEKELKKIFTFIEKLYREGDPDMRDLIGISIVEDFYYAPDYEQRKEKLFSLCQEPPGQASK